MPSVLELSDRYASFLRSPPPSRPIAVSGLCRVCRRFTDGRAICLRCSRQPRFADAILPISYSVRYGPLHWALRAYKDGVPELRRRFGAELAAVLWRFLDHHEACLASAAGAPAFDVATTVPSSVAAHDRNHPLRVIVGERVARTAPRHERLLTVPERDAGARPARARPADASPAGAPPARARPPRARVVDHRRFLATRALHGEHVLLIDDTWVTGATAQSAAGALKQAGAATVAVLVIGRHMHAEHARDAARLHELRAFSWDRCGLCAEESAEASQAVDAADAAEAVEPQPSPCSSAPLTEASSALTR